MSGPVDMSPEQLADFVHLLRYHEASARRRCLEFMAASFGMAADYVERHPPQPAALLGASFTLGPEGAEVVLASLALWFRQVTNNPEILERLPPGNYRLAITPLPGDPPKP